MNVSKEYQKSWRAWLTGKGVILPVVKVDEVREGFDAHT